MGKVIYEFDTDEDRDLIMLHGDAEALLEAVKDFSAALTQAATDKTNVSKYERGILKGVRAALREALERAGVRVETYSEESYCGPITWDAAEPPSPSSGGPDEPPLPVR